MPRIELEKVVKFNEFLVTPFFLVSRSLSQNIYLPTPIDVRQLSTMLYHLFCSLHLLPASFDEHLFLIKTYPSWLPLPHLFLSSASTQRHLVITTSFLLSVVWTWDRKVAFDSS